MKKVLVLFLLSTICMMNTYAGNVSSDNVVATEEGKGDGSEANPYLISTTEDLVKLSSDVKAGNSFEGKYLALTNDIDLSEIENFYPIGTLFGKDGNALPFNGTFDGRNFTVKGLHQKYSGEDNGVGLFGYVIKGTIKNLKLDESTIDVGSVAGGIVGTLQGGKISNCHVGKNVNIIVKGSYGAGIVGGIMAEAAIIEDCVNEATVNTPQEKCTGMTLGGIVSIVATANGTVIRRCVNLGNITAYTEQSAGILAYNPDADVTVEDCVNFGTIGGDVHCAGLVSLYTHDITVKNCYNIGEIVCASTDYEHLRCDALLYFNLNGSKSNCQNLFYASDLCKEESQTGTKMQSADMKSEDFVKKLNNGREDGPWRIVEGVANGFPIPTLTAVPTSIDETFNTVSEMEIRYNGNMVVVSGVKAGNTISVVDMNGRIVKNAVAANDGQMTIDIEALPKGVYVVGNSICNKKIVK